MHSDHDMSDSLRISAKYFHPEMTPKRGFLFYYTTRFINIS
jgi:hypothetical protein